MPTHKIIRLPGAAADKLIKTVLKAQESASLEPLEPLVPEGSVDEEAHILRGRKYIVFGDEQRSLIGVGTLVRVGLTHQSLESLELGSSLVVGVERGRAAGVEEKLISKIVAALDNDMGLPEALRGDQGPSLLEPSEVSEFAAGITRLLEIDTVQNDEALSADLQSLMELVGRVEEGEGLVLFRSP